MYCKFFNYNLKPDTESQQHETVVQGRDLPPIPATVYSSCKRAFTLLEIMVVVVIIGLLASLVTVRARSYLTVSRQNAAKVEISKIADALEAFYAIQNRYPNNEEGIAILCEKTPKFPDGLLNKVPKDPWGHDYIYNCPGRTSAYEIICYAADGKEGGENENTDIISGEY